MAKDKKGYLRDAQKLVQKGQLDRAITTYRAILKIDPNDVKVHNTLGDLFIKQKQKKDGINEYIWVVNFYEKDGFYLRSIAMCQKVLNLDPERVEIQMKLGDLYAQQKLTVEAKRQYLKVADFYEKKKKVSEALEVFSKIADLDPGNVQIRIKLAVNYEKQSLPSKAAAEYSRAAEGYLKGKEHDKAAEFLDKALKLDPGNERVCKVSAEIKAGREEWPEVVEILKPLIGKEKVEVPVLKTFAAACLRMDKVGEAVEALERARKEEPSSLPLKTLLGKAYLQGARFDEAFDLFLPIISDFLKNEKLEAAEDIAREVTEAAPGNEKAQQKLLEILELKEDKEGAAGVCLKLAEIHEAGGNASSAVEVLEKLLELTPGNAAAAKKLVELQGEGAPGSGAEEPAEDAPPEKAPAEEVPPAGELEVDMIDLEGDGLSDLSAIAAEAEEIEIEPVEAVSAFEAEEGEEFDEEEIVIDEDEFEAALEDEEPSVEEPAAAASPVAEELPVEEEILVEEDASFEEPAAAASPVSEELPDEEEILVAEEPSSGEALQPEAPDEIVEEVDLEKDDLFSSDDVASLIEEGVLDAEASRPAVVEEPAAAEPAAVSEEPPLVEEEVVVAGEASETMEDEGLGLDLDSLAGAEEVEAPPAETMEAAVAAPSGEMEEFLAEADFYLQQGLLEEAEFLYKKLAKIDPESPHIVERLERLEQEKTGVSPEPEGESLIDQDEIAALESDLDRVFGEERTKAPEKAHGGLKISVSGGSGGEEPGEFSDFLSELRDELEPEVSEPEAVVDDQEGLGAIFQEFQEGLKEQLGEEDFETHYNLGIAYKEMGLMQEALGEFVLSEKSQARRLDSISMMAICLGEMGREEDAVQKLREGLELTEGGSDKQKGFLYDLGDLFARMGKAGESKGFFERLHRLDPSYRNVKARAAGPDEAPEEEPDKGTGTSGSKKSRVSYL